MITFYTSKYGYLLRSYYFHYFAVLLCKVKGFQSWNSGFWTSLLSRRSGDWRSQHATSTKFKYDIQVILYNAKDICVQFKHTYRLNVSVLYIENFKRNLIITKFKLRKVIRENPGLRKRSGIGYPSCAINSTVMLKCAFAYIGIWAQAAPPKLKSLVIEMFDLLKRLLVI